MATNLPPILPASDYARQIGVTTDAVVKRIQRGKLRGYKIGDRWHVETPAPIDVTLEPAEPESDLPIPAGDAGPASQLAAIADYNSRLVEPWVKRVSDLEEKVREQAVEIGDLRRQVRQLKRALEGMESALRRVVGGGEE